MTVEQWRAPLDEAALRDRVLGAGGFWRRLDVVAETGSTNADLLARAERGEDIDGAVLIAEHQTAGRGRQGRTWSDVPGAVITMSVGVDAASVPTAGWGWVPLATGVAIVDAVTPLGVTAGLKWPNDVLAGDGKLAGILVEVAPTQQSLVIGIGLNVSLRPDEIGVPDATSLVALGVADPDRAAVIERLLSALGRRLAAWRAAGGADAALVADYRARSRTLGMKVRALLPGGRELVGVARDIDGEGRLLVETTETVTVSAGDVVHVHPAGN
ncbi:biotin--[acetyl-CoA-carboxylase] ligase [Mycolicibacterium hassiacum DSM 44199]|jgi:BirA family biotin operon repressor/biotin-[acetyl-CoA-carboxylase] ligase|uniref:Biotin--[acetyl-CoA-carboxylase] ligase n=1 Tax=Mycolicibacterium hassiacum (strain DSM 44199 / CIP 105218 / JCM 12690 / 3849) TaxID=1122247 RepID=K5B917_MYCHD|nr:biotin--[acetyl-CoA-carboxylase] ligase [Mycolicibacterium hassiacum]EKF24668.1 biotin--[acetyl-CoA-carboxylase] ligase [Mycolicibacterium hassiacum DSM 44199]MBX5485555.1 biotin--[acetyl-CoA-carboxylase] ligase [Mycolicibacterium hassiacum]MDA4087002.1 biotin--acetyl-CoA-carboxylase ligase [Mycolicibacterium hassiacum DSM 44199]VCT88807.1 Bifunctional ligase/repressor BirA [Mycolicibacterium hassiacum DSM 44199]